MSTCARSILAAVAAIAAVGCITAIALASSAVQIAAGPYEITPSTYWTSVKMSCPAGEASCNGVVSLETAHAIKPYRSRPSAKAQVATVAYSVPAGTTKAIKARVYGPALAQAILTHRVALRITAREAGATTPATSRIAIFTLAHR